MTRGTIGLVAGTALGAVVARAAYRSLTRRPPGMNGLPGAQVWGRTNHRGEPVTLLEGPAFVAGAAAAGLLAPGTPGRMRAAALLAGAGSGVLGGYDDLAGSASSRGFKGHLGALARGEVTSGAVKILGIGATGLAAAAVAGSDAPSRGGRALDALVNGAIIAGSANLMNLFDLRPGRAIKVGLIAGVPLALTPSTSAVVAAPLGAAAALLPEDLAERAMLGDTGSNALGALLGLAATRLGRGPRLAVLAGLAGLNAASEFVSFTKVIRETPALNWVDMLGRRPVAVPGAGPSVPVPPQPGPVSANGGAVTDPAS
jgi:UDP-N-acetylmuramyl pentapeptide phosphotransferase/UDP-N-acetylglucosamine-1-phosphate transferase